MSKNTHFETIQMEKDRYIGLKLGVGNNPKAEFLNWPRITRNFRETLFWTQKYFKFRQIVVQLIFTSAHGKTLIIYTFKFIS